MTKAAQTLARAITGAGAEKPVQDSREDSKREDPRRGDSREKSRRRENSKRRGDAGKGCVSCRSTHCTRSG